MRILPWKLVLVGERSPIYCSHDCQYAVKMVILVLKELGEIILKFHGSQVPSHVPVFDGTALVSPHPDKEVWEAHTIIPEFNHLITHIFQDWIEKDNRRVDVHIHDTFHYSDLRSRNSSTNAMFLSEVHHRVMQVLDHFSNGFQL